MKNRKFTYTFFTIALLIPGSLFAQQSEEDAINSITASELRDHIFFLASDYLNGRYAPTADYAIAAKYVESQFAAAGLEPVVEQEDGSMSYLQGVPFAKTEYSDELRWRIIKDGTENELTHREDFKVMMGSKLNYNKAEMVWVGYGIEEPDHKWNDFKGLDVKGKIMICMGGAPIKKGKPVLPEDIHKKYIGQQGFSTKISQTLFRKGAAGIILIDLDSEIGVGYDQIPSQISKEKYVFKGDDNESQMGSFPSIYLVKSNFLNTIFADSKNNPLKNPDNILKHYKTQVLEDTYLTAGIEIISEDIILSNNVIGMVAGTDPELKNEYIVVGAHLDHVSPQQGQVCNGADDNASGSSGVMEIAEAVAMNPFKRSVIFITFTAEEMGLIGSRFFLNSDLFPKEQIKFNINMDMIGRSDPKNEESRAHYVVTHKKYVNELEAFINEINDGVTDFPLIINNDEDSPGGSDHQSFIGEDIPAFFFFSGLHRDLHRPTDDADKIDYPKAESISKLAYLIASKLANMETVPSFEAVK